MKKLIFVPFLVLIPILSADAADSLSDITHKDQAYIEKLILHDFTNIEHLTIFNDKINQNTTKAIAIGDKGDSFYLKSCEQRDISEWECHERKVSKYTHVNSDNIRFSGVDIIYESDVGENHVAKIMSYAEKNLTYQTDCERSYFGVVHKVDDKIVVPYCNTNLTFGIDGEQMYYIDKYF